MQRKTSRRPWGTARKAINLFLRACVHSYYLRKEYGLRAIKRWLEIPLDSVVARAMKRRAGRGALPAWPGLKHISEEDYAEFQTYGVEWAKSFGLPTTVDLDMSLWLNYRQQ